MMNSLSRVALPLCLAAGALGASLPATAQDLKIGFLAPRTGIFAQLGTDMVNGFQMYLDEHDGKLGGAKVSFIIEDDQGKPDIDVAKAKKLILQDKVDMLVGAVLASSAYAPATRATNASPRSPPIMRSATSKSAASRRASRTAAVRSCRRSGCRSAP